MKTRRLIYISIFAILTAVGARIAVPLPLVPFTLQTMFCMLAGLLLGPKYGAASQAFYMFMGLLGVPVFTGGGGLSSIFMPSFGYVIGFRHRKDPKDQGLSGGFSCRGCRSLYIWATASLSDSQFLDAGQRNASHEGPLHRFYQYYRRGYPEGVPLVGDSSQDQEDICIFRNMITGCPQNGRLFHLQIP